MPLNKIRLGIESIFTTTVQDETGKVIEKWTVMKSDFGRVVKILDSKFNLNIFKKKPEKRDLEWAGINQ